MEPSTMAARIIDGKALAAALRIKVAAAARRLAAEHGITPGLAVVLVGNNPASESYVGSKARQTAETAMHSSVHRLPETASEAELLGLVRQLNADPAVHGILVQLPLPAQIDRYAVQIKFQDIVFGHETRCARPRHEKSRRIFRISHGDVAEGIHQPQMRDDSIGNHQFRNGRAGIHRGTPSGLSFQVRNEAECLHAH